MRTFARHEVTVADGTTISYLDSGGAGSPVVVLHGLAGSSTELLPTAEALGGHRVVLVDQRGHGHSTRRPADTSREAFVGDVVALLETLDRGPAVLVGQSMGAHTAMLVAAARPDLVERLVLLECDAGSGTPQEHRRLGEFFTSWPVPFPDREAAAQFLGDSPLATAWVADLEETPDGLNPRFDPDVLVATIATVATPRWHEWENLQVPAVVVYAAHGMFGEAQRAEFVARGRDVVRIDLPRGSHDAHLDAFEDWIAVLRDSLGPRRIR
ncbi:alpha/beta fold hydrolase [Isoptericola aurantiacus]|uniref:alpha/beta fold hydrolase n=1 Tax=Isoptericola aurantiacus TaxID=3377839 RepID=UPI00383B9BEF